MEITGGSVLQGADLISYGDHRIAMAFAVAGLFAEGVTTISDTDCIATSYPTFEKHLQLFQEPPKENLAPTPVIDQLPPRLATRLSQPDS
jgi:3-phosphoshikimate 1-carboxyvinyltransferase